MVSIKLWLLYIAPMMPLTKYCADHSCRNPYWTQRIITTDGKWQVSLFWVTCWEQVVTGQPKELVDETDWIDFNLDSGPDLDLECHWLPKWITYSGRDRKNTTLLVLLDLLAVFDTIVKVLSPNLKLCGLEIASTVLGGSIFTLRTHSRRWHSAPCYLVWGSLGDPVCPPCCSTFAWSRWLKSSEDMVSSIC